MITPYCVDLGKQGSCVNQYLNDYMTGAAMKDERSWLPMILDGLDRLVGDLRAKLGDPMEGGLRRRTAIVMVANEGILDLLLNFLCSVRAAGIRSVTDNLVVFVGNRDYAAVIEAMGVKAFYSSRLGDIPNKAAGSYGDRTFGKMMWLKTTSVYLTAKAGFNVIFQVLL